MIITQTRTRRSHLFLLFPLLLLLAHTAIILAVLSFGTRADGYPLTPVALSVYALSLFGAMVYLLMTMISHRQSADRLLLAIAMPLFASLMFAATLWISSDAVYAPYDVADADAVLFFNLIISVVIVAVGVGYRSHVLLQAGFIVQLAVYLMAHSLPNWIRYPSSGVLTGIFGIRPSIPLFILGGYIMSTAVLHWHKQRVALPPHWQFGVILINLVAGWMAYVLFAMFPGNGMWLGWRTPSVTVPFDGWNWMYTLAQMLTVAAMSMPVIIGGVIFFASIDATYEKERERQPLLRRFRRLLPILALAYVIMLVILSVFIWRASPGPKNQELLGIGIGDWRNDTGVAFLSGRRFDCELTDDVLLFTTRCEVGINGKTAVVYMRRNKQPTNFPLGGECELFYDGSEWPCRIGSRHIQVQWFAYVDQPLGLDGVQMDALRRRYFFENLPEDAFLYGGVITAVIAALLAIANFGVLFWEKTKKKHLLFLAAIPIGIIVFYSTLFLSMMLTSDFWD